MDEDAGVDWIPLWKHRMSKIMDILAENAVESVLDIGCGEGKLLQCMRHNPKITSLAGVDVDIPSLTKAIPALQPLLTDMLQPRLKPLIIELYRGSVDTIDVKFTGYDAAILVEVIEHLDPTVLYKCPSVVLGTLRPKLVVMSTPNSEFNVHFGPQREGILRHDDHRFEWTRKEFETWSNTVAQRYGYEVAFDGVGDPKPEFPGVGYCTQIAIFKRTQRTSEDLGLTPSEDLPFPLIPEVYCDLWTKNPLRREEADLGDYTLFHRLDYPTFTGNIEEEIHHTLVYCYKTLSRNEYNQYDPSVSVTVDDLLQHSKIRRLCETKENLVKCLEDSMVFSVSDEGVVTADLDLQFHEDQNYQDSDEEHEGEASSASRQTAPLWGEIAPTEETTEQKTETGAPMALWE